MHYYLIHCTLCCCISSLTTITNFYHPINTHSILLHPLVVFHVFHFFPSSPSPPTPSCHLPLPPLSSPSRLSSNSSLSPPALPLSSNSSLYALAHLLSSLSLPTSPLSSPLHSRWVIWAHLTQLCAAAYKT